MTETFYYELPPKIRDMPRYMYDLYDDTPILNFVEKQGGSEVFRLFTISEGSIRIYHLPPGITMKMTGNTITRHCYGDFYITLYGEKEHAKEIKRITKGLDKILISLISSID